MMIRVGDDYLDFDGSIIIEKQILDLAKLDTVGAFSYSFDIKPTNYNKKLLRIEERVITIDNVIIESNSGVQLYLGYINIEDFYKITITFFTDNSNLKSALSINVNELDLSGYDILLNEDNVVDSWSADTGIVFPLIDKGELHRRKDAFLKLRIKFGRLDQNDFHPFIFVKDVVAAIMLKANIKLGGELIKDSTYNTLITTNNSTLAKNKILEKDNIYVGSKTVQLIANGSGSAVKISFDLASDLPYFNSTNLSYDTVNNRWTVKYQSRVTIKYSLLVSDSTKLVIFDVRRNGTSVATYSVKNTKAEIDFGNPFDSQARTEADDYYELWAYVDPSTAGTVNFVSGSVKTTIDWSNMCFASALTPAITCAEFLSDIFKMFNVMASYDPFKKQLNTTLFKNIDSKEEIDLSEYVSDIEELNGTDLITQFAKVNTMGYGQIEIDEIENYNTINSLEYASGSIDVNNTGLANNAELFTLNFKAPFVYRNEVFGLYLIKLPFVEYNTQDSGFNFDITSVTSSAGKAQFNYSSGNKVFYNNNFTEDAQGSIFGISGGLDGSSENESGFQQPENDSQIICIYQKDVTLPVPFRFSLSGDGGINPNPDPNQYWTIQRLEDMTNPLYDGDWEQTGFASVTRNTCGVAVFTKSQDQTPLDIVRQGLCFSNPKGFNSLSIIDTYYKGYQTMINNSETDTINFILPEKVFLSIDLTNPIRVKTELFNNKYIVHSITGYENSWSPCTMQLIKLP